MFISIQLLNTRAFQNWTIANLNASIETEFNPPIKIRFMLLHLFDRYLIKSSDLPLLK